MKRSVAVCLMAGVLLVMSTAAFATPITGDVLYNNTVTSGITNSTTYPSGNGTITWFQPYSPVLPTATFIPAGGTLGLQITSAALTIVASGVNDGQIDNVAIQNPVTSAWESLGSLNDLASGVWSGNTTTSFGWGSATGTTYSFPLTGATGIDWLAGATGFNAKVTLTTYPTNQGDTVVSSNLSTKTHYTYTPPTPPVVPAPGAILLASMGAGLVSWLRARKAL